MAQIHEYPVKVQWSGGRDGKGNVTLGHSGISADIAVPPEFQGPGGGASPEELLTAAVASCYSITFGIIAANRKLPVESLDVEVNGEVEQNGPNFTFKKVTIRPTIRLGEGADRALAEDIAHKADGYCIITNSVRGKVEVVVEPQIA